MRRSPARSIFAGPAPCVRADRYHSADRRKRGSQDLGNGLIKVRMIAGNASIFTSQGSGVGRHIGLVYDFDVDGNASDGAAFVGGLISGAGITSGTTVAAYDGVTSVTLSAAMTVAGGTTVSWGAACPSTPPSNVIQASPMAGYYVMYTQARVCAVSPGGPVNTLLIEPIFYDQTTQNGSGGGGSLPPGAANQLPVYTGSGNAVTPTGISAFFDTVCSSTVGQAWVRMTGGWGCTSLGYANPVWWGAVGDGATNNSPFVKSARQALDAWRRRNHAFSAGQFLA